LGLALGGRLIGGRLAARLGARRNSIVPGQRPWAARCRSAGAAAARS
jgi:hypothetical protein